ncbi:MAG: endonuclease domain-containing protein [Candidatus Kapaibacterium sp.]|nr:endonuclease domain-containing protein [Bacteroidota bacterium]
MNIHNRNYLKSRRQFLRNHATSAEKLLWNFLKGSKNGFKFRRQHSIGNYIVDFYNAELRLVIEIDGDSHDSCDAIEYDLLRTQFLESLNVTVIRFTNQSVYDNIYGVLEVINDECIKQQESNHLKSDSPPETGGD